MKLKIMLTMLLVAASLLFASSSLALDEPKTVSLKGKVFLADIKQPVVKAKMILLDKKKSDGHSNSVETETDDQGNYVFEKVVPGKYTVSIRTWHQTQEEAPCKLLMAKTADKNSTVMVISEKDKFVQQVFIDDFSIKSGKDMTKDFDISCKSMFGG